MGMIKINETLEYNEKNYKRVSYRKIKNMLKDGDELKINLIPNNANLYSPWISFCEIEVSSLEEFEERKNSFEVHNCGIGLGNTVHYYLEEVIDPKCKELMDNIEFFE